MRELSRKDESQRPGRYASQELAVTVEEPPKVVATGRQKNVQKHDPPSRERHH
jgi:hypothetical protein